MRLVCVLLDAQDQYVCGKVRCRRGAVASHKPIIRVGSFFFWYLVIHDHIIMMEGLNKQASLILCKGYIPEKCYTNQNCTTLTQNSHLKH